MKKYTFILLILFLLVGCSNKLEKYSTSFLSFDTYIELNAYTSDKDEFYDYAKYTEQQFKKYHELFDAYNNYQGVNNVKVINDNAGKKAIKVDEHLYEVIKQAKELYQDSEQKNNITLTPIVLEYKAVQERYDANEKVSNPDLEMLKEKAKCVNMDNIILNEQEQSIFLKKSCSQLDVGSVAKGYTTDLIANELKDKGLTSGIINAGGNVVVIGKKNNSDFTIGIANPDNPNEAKINIKTSDINIVTSGDYQRYYIVDGIKMNHIIDPDTLKPALINKSVTIINNDGLIADYFSTECFMLDLEKIDKLAQKYDFEYIVIDKNDKITISEGLKDVTEVK
ncbi:FAD:protein FMN transferase [Erysipelotrichaceae bacterium OttesenSCG-928-M19]|nr:FAD:protein FMN transferase [Erysipelotrichaceae bacterium OttesenSCG-928-M19]